MKNELYIVDISSYIFRAYYAVRPLNTKDGLPTNAIYGVITMMLKLIKQQNPKHLVVVFDSKVPSFRKEIYQDYKANRETPPEDLLPQFDYIREFIETYPIPHLQCDGCEADDIIASLVRKFDDEKEWKIKIVSSDKDLMQLINDDVCMYDSMREKIYTPKEVLEKFEVTPNQIIDLLSLAGDSSDNIPGISGVGPKTAAKLINEYSSLEAIIENADQLKGKLAEKVKAGKENAFLSKRLVTLKDDIEVPDQFDFYQLREADIDQLNQFYTQLELNSLVTKNDHKKEEVIKKDYQTISTEEALNDWIKKIKTNKRFCFDTETTGLNPLLADLVGISLAVENEACYIPLRHCYLGCPPQLSLEGTLEKLKPIFEDSTIKKVAQNAKYDLHILENYQIKVQGLDFDTMIASYLIDPASSHNMDYLAEKYLQYKTIHFDEVVPKGETFDSVEINQATNYSAEDADVTLKLYQLLKEEIKNNQLQNCFDHFEIPLVEVLTSMEREGIGVNKKSLDDLDLEFKNRLEELEKIIHRLAGEEFNIQSPKQLADILFEKLKLTPVKKTKTGYSTNVEVLNQLVDEHEIIQHLLEFRTLAKLKSTYTEQLSKIINPHTGRIHTSFGQTIAATGRLSSKDPNLQNIPIRGDQAKKIRAVFEAKKNHLILSADYSQIELRLLAHFSKDQDLLEAFINNIDIHHLTARKIFNLEKEEVTQDLRSRAKTVNFGILYGQSAFGLSSLLNISQKEAKQYIEDFYQQFPSVMNYKEKALNEIKQTGIVRTLSNRLRRVPEINSKNKMVVKNAERFAFNTIFQGSAADIIKLAMIKIFQKLNQENYQTKMLLQVHDELLFEVPLQEKDRVEKMVKTEMESAFKLEVPLLVETGWGNNWNSAH